MGKSFGAMAKTKGEGKPSRAKVAADKRKQQAESLERAKQRAYDRAFKQATMAAARKQGKADALKAAGKGGKRK